MGNTNLKKKIVITGMGVIAPNGIGLADFWSSIVEGRPATSLIRSFDANNFPIKIAAEVSTFRPNNFISPNLLRKIDRFVQLGLAATKLAIDDAGLNEKLTSIQNVRSGVCIGSGLGGILFHEDQIEALIRRGPDQALAAGVPKITPNAVSAHIGITLGLTGPNLVISTACSSGSNAIGIGCDLIKLERADLVIAGGVEAPITPTTLAAYAALRVLSNDVEEPQKACRPFDKTRKGFVLGEGAGIVVLESFEHATQRNARIYAEIAGFGSNCGAYHIVTPDPSGADAAEAMLAALKDAELPSEAIDYINAHGTGTVANDLSETTAIKRVFLSRAYKIPVSSTKAVTGHLIGAAGAVECIASTLALVNNVIPQTANYKHCDPECDLDYVPVSREKELRTVMSNSFGFGSNNAVLILRRL